MLWSAFAGSPTAIGTSPFQCESMQALKSAVKALSSPLSRAVFPGSLANSGTTVRPLAALRAKTASSAEAAKDSEAAGKARALEQAMKEINAKCGAGTIMRFGDNSHADVPVTSSGALTLDLALGGGYPTGKIVEIFGMESSGKSTLGLHAIAEVQKQGGVAALIDAENAFDKVYAARLGVDVAELRYGQANTCEDAFTMMELLINSGAMDLICVDSVAALTPRAEVEGEFGSSQMGVHARLMSQGLRKLTGLCGRKNCTLIFLNQIRHKIIAFGNPETTTGGMALAFYSSVRMRVGRGKGGSLLDAKGEEQGIRAKVKVVKNKCAPPMREAEFDVMWRGGISKIGCMLDAAEKVGVVTKKGSWYSYKDSNLAQGRDKAVTLLTADPELYNKIEEETRQRFKDPEAAFAEPSDTASLDEDLEADDELHAVELGN